MECRSVGRNIGALSSKGKYILFLDDDCIVDESAISKLVQYASARPECGALGPIVCEFPERNRIRAAGTSINLLTGKNSFNLSGQIDIGQFPEVLEVQIFPDACLVKRLLYDFRIETWQVELGSRLLARCV
jgi:GT2 family glycosyltransferase